VRGRKRHIVVDTQGHLLRVWVHAADLTDRTAAAWWLEVVQQAVPTLQHLFADGGYSGALVDWARDHLQLTVEIVKKLADQQGFVVLPKRWIVERTLAWFSRQRRLAKDYEYWPECSEAWLYLASIRLLVRRLARCDAVS
jgi:putative transposase